MSATLDQIVYNLASMIDQSQDPVILERIRFMVHSSRATLLRRDFKRNFQISPSTIQTIPCLEMEKYEGVECCGVVVPSGCVIYRSKVELPETIRFQIAPGGFSFVGTVDLRKSFGHIYPFELRYYVHRKYGSKIPRYFVSQGRLYVVGSKPKHIRIDGIFEDPTKLSEIQDCSGSSCYDRLEPYPIPSDMIDGITRMVSAQIMRELPADHAQTTLQQEQINGNSSQPRS